MDSASSNFDKGMGILLFDEAVLEERYYEMDY